jgi:acyl-[acyl-carrier-protein]-phospholipid O-acyltransferase / long-chain-fatty-acid--[acyl-carrier-protein] ligase
MTRMTYVQAQARADADKRTVGAEFLKQARRAPRQIAVTDAGGALSRIRLAGVALALGPRLGLAADERRIGILLPAGRAGTVANLAVALLGRTAVNLNHTMGPAILVRMCQQAEVRTVITAHAYLDRIGRVDLPARLLYAEDLLGDLSKGAVLAAMLKILFVPPHRLDRSRSRDVAALVFSSGSVGDPKGVQLTHQQLIANCDAVMLHLDLHPGRDRILSPLPLFHVFGLVPGMWLELVKGFGIAAQADPRDGEALGKLAEATRPTFLISAPTFVRGYLRRVRTEQFASLRFAVVGAEACPQDLFESFQDCYDRPLYEGYGTTELSPVVSVNSPEAHCIGSVGRPVPGVEVFTVDPRTEEILPQGERGLLVVRSPARMLGYLNQEALTQKVFVHGGYNTRDVGWVDTDGFIYLTGRMARFAKIGGEMVPMDNIEEALQHYLDEGYHWNGLVAVTAIEDPGRGERLVVLHEPLPCATDDLHRALEALPPLFRPKRADYFEVPAIPLLGSGKRDVVSIRHLAERLVKGRGPEAD